MTPTDGHDERKRIFLLDGHSLAYRAYFALPATLATSTGQITNAVYGFTSMLIKLMGDEHPDYLAVAFDLGRPTVRLEKYAEYKAGRAETPTDFTSQLGLIDEVLDTLHVPMVRVVDHEADDAIGTLANRATESGLDAVIVTADRDFFQLVRPGIQVMFNRRGISDIVLYDEAGVEERFGVPPSKYLEYVALKGDPSDNIPGVPGVGEKTAAKLIQQYGSVEELLAHADELRGKLKDNVLAAADQLALNKELARIVTDLPLDIGPEDCVLGEWDPDEVRRLFTSLEFRSLLDRLEEIGVTKPKVEVTELDLRETSADELAQMIGSDAPKGVRLDADLREVRGAAASPGGAQAAFAPLAALGPVADALASAGAPKWTHDAKELERGAIAAGVEVRGVVFDTFLAGYLLDPAAAEYPLRALSEKYLGVDVLGEVDGQDEGQLFSDAGWRPSRPMRRRSRCWPP